MVMTKEDVKHHTTCHINMLHHVYMKTRDNKLEKLNQIGIFLIIQTKWEISTLETRKVNKVCQR